MHRTVNLLSSAMYLLLSMALDCRVAMVTAESQYVLPEFGATPPPLTYVTPGSHRPLRLPCAPPAAAAASGTEVQCGYRTAPDWSDIRYAPSGSTLLPGIRCLQHAVEVTPALATNIDQLELFCKAVSASNFALISAPFRVRFARLEPFSDSPSLVAMQRFKGNKVQLECQPPVSVSPADIVFTVNGSPVSQTERFKTVRLASGMAALIISKVLSDDGNKVYGCNATNTFTGQTVQSPRLVNLTVTQPALLDVPHNQRYQEAVNPFPPKLLSPPTPTSLTVLEGDSLAYTCITESSPIAEVSFLRDEGRKQLPLSVREDRKFGLLQFVNVSVEDAGEYACRVSYRRDMAPAARDETLLNRFQIIVKKRLTIAVKPSDVVMHSPDSDARFICRISGGTGRRTPLWYNNGRFLSPRELQGLVIQDHASDPGMSTVLVPRMHPSIRGIFQCVASDPDNGIWESAHALLTVRGDTLQRPTDPPAPQTTASPPDRGDGPTRPSGAGDQVFNNATGVAYKVLKQKERFAQIHCGNQYSQASDLVFTFLKDGRPVNVTPNGGQNPFNQYNSVLSLVWAGRPESHALYPGVYQCRVTDPSTRRLLFVQITYVSVEPEKLPTDPDLAVLPPRPTGSPPSGTGGGIGSGTGGEFPVELTTAPEARRIDRSTVVNISWWYPRQLLYIIKYYRVQYCDSIATGARVASAECPGEIRTLDETVPATAGVQASPLDTLRRLHVVWAGARPGRVYRFRLAFHLTAPLTAGGAVFGLTEWSQPTVSFADIVGPPPVITDVPRRSSEEPLKWTYDASSHAAAVGFVIWARRQLDNGSNQYTKYRVDNGSARQYYFYDLQPGFEYTLRMYAALELGANPDSDDGLLRSPDSTAVTLRLPARSAPGGNRDRDLGTGGNKDLPEDAGSSRTMLLLLIVGGLAGLLLLVGLALLGFCLFRRYRRRNKMRRSHLPTSHLPPGFPPPMDAGCTLLKSGANPAPGSAMATPKLGHYQTPPPPLPPLMGYRQPPNGQYASLRSGVVPLLQQQQQQQHSSPLQHYYQMQQQQMQQPDYYYQQQQQQMNQLLYPEAASPYGVYRQPPSGGGDSDCDDVEPDFESVYGGGGRFYNSATLDNFGSRPRLHQLQQQQQQQQQQQSSQPQQRRKRRPRRATTAALNGSGIGGSELLVAPMMKLQQPPPPPPQPGQMYLSQTRINGEVYERPEELMLPNYFRQPPPPTSQPLSYQQQQQQPRSTLHRSASSVSAQQQMSHFPYQQQQQQQPPRIRGLVDYSRPAPSGAALPLTFTPPPPPTQPPPPPPPPPSGGGIDSPYLQ